MAIEKTVEIKVNASQAQQTLDKLGGTFEDVYGEAKPLSTVIGELEDRLYEMAIAGDTSSDEFKKITKEVGNMRKTIVETDLKIDAMSTTLNQKIGGALGGVTAAFSLGAGVMGAFGVESEKVQEVLLRVQSAMAIQEGVRGIKEAIPSFKALFNTIRTGIAATGIGLFVLALGAIAVYWDDIKGAMSGVSSEQEEINRLAAENVELQKENLETLSANENILKLEGKTQREILKLKRAQTDEIIAATEEQIRQSEITLEQQVKTTQGYKDTMKSIIEFLNKPIEYLFKAMDKLFGTDYAKTIDATNDMMAGMFFDPDQVREEGQVLIDEQRKELDKIRNQRAGFQLSINAIDRAASEERIKIAQEEADRLAEIQRVSLEDIPDAIEAPKLPDAPDMPKVEDATFEEERELQELQLAKMYHMRNEWRKKEEETEKEHVQRKISIADRYAENTMKGLQSISSLNDALTDIAVAKAGDNEEEAEKARKKGFERSKKLQIAMAVVQGVQGVMAAFTAGSSMGPAGVVMGPLMAAAAGVSAIANIAKIKNQKYEGSSSASLGAGASTPRISEPATFNVIGDSGTNQIAEGIGQQNNTPVKAYVVGKDVTSQQELDRNTLDTATFG